MKKHVNYGLPEDSGFVYKEIFTIIPLPFLPCTDLISQLIYHQMEIRHNKRINFNNGKGTHRVQSFSHLMKRVATIS
jgi:hypothetical protein